MKPLLLRLHRWTTLVFAVPLAVLIVTGLVLSLEPILQDKASRTVKLPASEIVALLDKHDPAGKARSISVRAYENRINIQGIGEDGSMDFDLATKAPVDDGETTMLSDVFGDMRRLHEHFIFDLGWVVTASTIAMVALMLIGVVMGWPRIRNTISGWHQGTAWILLPILILSPVTGLMLAFRINIGGALPPQDKATPPSLKEAITMLGKDSSGAERDLGGLIWLRSRGGRLLARVNEGGIFNVYQVARSGVKLTPANWSRGLHEGNLAGMWTGFMVFVTSLAFVGLMVTGLTIWFRRTFLRKRNRDRSRPAPVAQQS